MVSSFLNCFTDDMICALAEYEWPYYIYKITMLQIPSKRLLTYSGTCICLDWDIDYSLYKLADQISSFTIVCSKKKRKKKNI